MSSSAGDRLGRATEAGTDHQRVGAASRSRSAATPSAATSPSRRRRVPSASPRDSPTATIEWIALGYADLDQPRTAARRTHRGEPRRARETLRSRNHDHTAERSLVAVVGASSEQQIGRHVRQCRDAVAASGSPPQRSQDRRRASARARYRSARRERAPGGHPHGGGPPRCPCTPACVRPSSRRAS